MIYEGAVIRRLVTPNHPGDPALDDPTVQYQFRTEYVKDDAKAPAPGSWTTRIGEAHRYPRHLDADRRAREISSHCFARVVTREEDFQTQDGEAVSRLAHNQKIAGSTPAPATNLPVDGSSSAGAVKQLPLSRGQTDDNQVRDSRPAGKTSSQRPPNRSRLAALRAAAKRVPAPPDTAWYREGQYA